MIALRPLPEVLVAGELFVDLILSGLSAFPEAGKEVFANDFARDIGGGASITACGLGALKIDCGVFGVVGTDTGKWLTSRLEEQGVATSEIRFHDSEPTAFTVIATAPHDRTFLSYEGANRAFEAEFLKALRTSTALSTRHIHLAFAPSFSHGFEMLDRIHASHCTVSLDVGWREDWLSHPLAFDMLRNVDLFFPNLLEGARLTGENEAAGILRALSSLGVKSVALKLGPLGSAFSENGRTMFVPGLAVSAVDTTGAGDSFDAGFLQAWLAGKDPEQCLARGNICGALSTTAYGGISGFPTLTRLEYEMERFTNV